MEVSEAWDILEDYYNVSEETLRIITDINGYSMNTMEEVLFAVAGESDFEDLEDE